MCLYNRKYIHRILMEFGCACVCMCLWVSRWCSKSAGSAGVVYYDCVRFDCVTCPFHHIASIKRIFKRLTNTHSTHTNTKAFNGKRHLNFWSIDCEPPAHVSVVGMRWTVHRWLLWLVAVGSTLLVAKLVLYAYENIIFLSFGCGCADVPRNGQNWYGLASCQPILITTDLRRFESVVVFRRSYMIQSAKIILMGEHYYDRIFN